MTTGAEAGSARATDGRGLDLLIVIPHLGPGGAQRVASLLANHWVRDDRRIGLLTLYDEPRDAHELAAGIARLSIAQPARRTARRTARRARRARPRRLRLLYRLGMDPPRAQALAARLSAAKSRAGAAVVVPLLKWPRMAVSQARIVRRILRLRAALVHHRPRVVISFLGATNIQTVLAGYRLPCTIVISERNDPALQALKPPWERLRPLVYPRADVVTANSRGAVESLAAYGAGDRVRQVPNPLLVRPCDPGCPRHQPRLIAVARLVRQKGIDVLLDAFAAIADEFPDWTLDIVGDGPLRGPLERQADARRIGHRVVFHGHQADPFPLLYRASVFVLPSRFEGMPNAMLEAMGCGLSIVATTASPGPLEFVTDGANGLLVAPDDGDGLARALRRLLADDRLRRQLSAAAEERVRGLDVATVAGQWEDLVREVADRALFPRRPAAGAACRAGASGPVGRPATHEDGLDVGRQDVPKGG